MGRNQFRTGLSYTSGNTKTGAVDFTKTHCENDYNRGIALRYRATSEVIFMTSDLSCSKCQSSMEEGFMPEYAHPQLLVTRWYPGAPKEADIRVLGMKLGEWLEVREDSMRLVVTFRCTACGYLESYAK